MKIAIYQGAKTPAEPSGNLDRLVEAADEARAGGARLVILPEMFLTGYNIGSDAIARLAEPVDGASATRAAEIAREAGIALLYGYPERGPKGEIFNAAILIDRDGRTLANHRKTHLFGDIDKSAFDPGQGPPTVAELDGLKLGVLICYDVEFPENVRLLALAGVDLVAVPTALMKPYEFVARSLVPSRAFENQVFLAYANRCGSERELDYYGLSCIVGPDGVDLARAGLGEELVITELDAERLARSRALNTYLRDRRPALYAPLTEPNDKKTDRGMPT